MSRPPAESSDVKSDLVIYRTEDGGSRIQVRLENESVWLTQAAMAELFETTSQNITLHLKSIYGEHESRRGRNL